MAQAEISATRSPAPIDVHVGSQVRLRRKQLGITQEALGDAIGVTFQQVQKYERGVNRIGASRLQQIARALDVPISFFFPQGEMAAEAAGSDRELALSAAENLSEALTFALRRARGEPGPDNRAMLVPVLRAARALAQMEARPDDQVVIQAAERWLAREAEEPRGLA